MTTDWATSRNDDRQRVLDATDIVALVGEHLALHAKGREYVAICPFHDDHKPSMCVVPHKQIFHCFACGAGGNAYDFMMRYHGMDFRQAIQHLAVRAGITLTPYKPRTGDMPGDQPASDVTSTRDDIARANAFALSFFRSILAHQEHGLAARQAINKRGFTDETIEDFQLGAAPDRWDGLLLTIGKQGLDTDHFLAAGLLKRRDDDGLYDALRNRVIFPILDQIGRPIAFGARRINEDDDPKYLNSPENALFDKSSTLFALDKATRPIQSNRRAIIVEGYTDAIACHQAGVHNVVATLGTALTSKHATALQRLCDRVVILFDADTAGLKAADRSVEVFFSSNVDVQIAVLPAGADPADLLETEGGRERFDAIIDTAEDALIFRFRRLSEQLTDAGVSTKAKTVERDIERLVELGLATVAPIRRRLIIRNYAGLIGVEEQHIIDAVAKARTTRERRAFVSANTNDEPGEPTVATRLGPLEHALGCLLTDPTLIHNVSTEDHRLLEPQSAPTPATRAIAQVIEHRAALEDTGPLATALDRIDDPDTRALAARAALTAERITGHNRERLREHLLDCLRQWRRHENRALTRSTSAITSPSMPDPTDSARAGTPTDQTATERNAATATDDITDDFATLADLIEARRKTHQSTGGDPLALPRPITP